MSKLFPLTTLALAFAAGSVSGAEARTLKHHHAMMSCDSRDSSGNCIEMRRARATRTGARHARRARRHLARQGAGCGSLSTVRASSGATACVASSAASKFQALINDLEATGYRIDFMGGWRRHGSVAESKHPAGLALDINQVGRGRVTRRLPGNATAIAARYGLLHGAVWHHSDAGHFEVMSTRTARLERLMQFDGTYASMSDVVASPRRHRRPRSSALVTSAPPTGADFQGDHFR
jgi:hypothetical protein